MDHAITAADVMTSPVVTTQPGASIKDVATLLLQARISAVPVLDEAGSLVGIVSEGDLLGRSAEDRLAGQEWWLAILSGPGQMEASEAAAASARQVREVMQAPVVTVDAATPLRDVAALLRLKSIKRAPVLRDGRMVGVVSRADLLRATEAQPALGGGLGRLADTIGSFFASPPAPHPHPAAMPPPPPTAANFQALVDASAQSRIDEKKAAAHAADLDRIEQVKTMLHDHLGTEMWQTLMTHARVTAAHGGEEIELLRFPSELCKDAGRKINNVDPQWAETLQGEPAEFYARWARDLKPAGFGLAARVVDYPGGMPGTIALTLNWIQRAA